MSLRALQPKSFRCCIKRMLSGDLENCLGRINSQGWVDEYSSCGVRIAYPVQLRGIEHDSSTHGLGSHSRRLVRVWNVRWGLDCFWKMSALRLRFERTEFRQTVRMLSNPSTNNDFRLLFDCVKELALLTSQKKCKSVQKPGNCVNGQ